MWALGGFLPQNELTPREEMGTLIAAPNENITISVPIMIKKKDIEKKKSIMGHEGKTKDECIWILPARDMPSNKIFRENDLEGTISNNEERLKSNLEILLERFLCLSAGYTKFSKELLEARKRRFLESSIEAETGPRTIAQVRRENKKNEQEQVNVQLEDQKDENNEARDELHLLKDIDITDSATNSRNLLHDQEDSADSTEKRSLEICSETLGVPQTSSDIALTESNNDSISISIYWLCKVNGRIIRGVTAIQNHSILPELPISNEVLNKQLNDNLKNKKDIGSHINSIQDVDNNLSILNRNAVDYLSLGLQHVQSINFTKHHEKLYISVTLEVQSNCPKNLTISAEVLDKKNRTSSSDLGSSSSTSVNSNNNSDKNSFSQTQRGLRWEKKLNYFDIDLKPYELKKLNFTAVISQSGLFSLNR